MLRKIGIVAIITLFVSCAELQQVVNQLPQGTTIGNEVIKSSFEKVGADKVWNSLINKYNSIPLTKNVNPDLTDYVTLEALEGVYTMIAVEEKQLRTKASTRTTDLLRKVFALQD